MDLTPETRTHIHEYLRQALTAAEKIGEPKAKAEACWNIACAQGVAGNSDGARQAMAVALRVPTDRDAREQVTDCLPVAEALLRGGDRTAAAAVVAEVVQRALALDDEYDRAFAAGDGATVQAKVGDVAGALATVAELPRDHRADALVGIVEALAEAHELGPAREVAGQIKPTDARPRALAAIAHAQAAAGDRTGAVATLKEAVAAAPAAGSGYGADWALHTVVTELAACGEIPQALVLAGRLGEPKHRTEAFCDIGAALRAAGDRAGAARVLATAAASAAQISDAFARKFTGADVAVAQAEAGDGAGAVATALAIPDDGQQNRALFLIVKAQSRAGDLAGAQATAERITNDRFRDFAWADVVAAAAKAREGITAQMALGRIVNPVSRGRAQHALALAQAEAGDGPGAALAAGAIADLDWRAHVHLDLARRLLRQGDPFAARRALADGLAVSPSPWLVREFADAHLRAGFTDFTQWITSQPDPAVVAAAWLGAAEGLLPEEPPTG